jgi:hypothetical protein
LLRVSLLAKLLLRHHRHRLAGAGIHDVIGWLLARAGADRKRGQSNQQQSGSPHRFIRAGLRNLEAD